MSFQRYRKVSRISPPELPVMLKKGCSTCDDQAASDLTKSEAYSDKPGCKFMANYDTTGAAKPLGVSVCGILPWDSSKGRKGAYDIQDFVCNNSGARYLGVCTALMLMQL